MVVSITYQTCVLVPDARDIVRTQADLSHPPTGLSVQRTHWMEGEPRLRKASDRPVTQAKEGLGFELGPCWPIARVHAPALDPLQA